MTEVVYTCGTYDLFHRGHLNVLQAASALGDRLLVGVSTDELVSEYKGRSPVATFEERAAIVAALRCVDAVIPQTNLDKYEAWTRLSFDVWALGDDWYGTEQYRDYEERLRKEGVRCVYLPYTSGISTSSRRQGLIDG